MLFDDGRNDQGALAKKRYGMMVELGTHQRHVNLRKWEKAVPIGYVQPLKVCFL